MIAASDAEKMIENLDVSIFDPVPSQTTAFDRKSLLAVQKAVREKHGSYVYLEIGSHLGGTIQPHLLDPRCTRIYSIDKRPLQQPDERGTVCSYPENSSARMLSLLEDLSPGRTGKIVCFDSDARDVDASLIAERPQLLFIDGEHTNRAVVSDFEFCLKAAAEDAVICFHDAHIVFRGLKTISRTLLSDGRRFRTSILGLVYAVALGQSDELDHPSVRELSGNESLFFLTSKARLFVETHLGERARSILRPVARAITRKDVWSGTYADH